jgi:hypothetical protein
MKHYDNEAASRYYNTIKPHYDFFKSVLPEESAIEAAEKKARELREKLERIKPIELETSPAADENVTAAEEKEGKEESAAEAGKKKAEKAAPKKVDAAMKKKLHTLLDDAATTDEFSGIVAQINQSATSQQLYINMMQRFKKDRGRELYKLIKGEFKQFLSESEPAVQTEVSENVGKADEESAKPETAQAEPKKVTAAMKRKLHMLLDEPATTDEFSGIVAQINQSANEEQLLTNMTQRFGSARGGELYTIIKEAYVKFISEKPRAKRKSAAKKSGAKTASTKTQTQSPAPVQASREDLEKMLHEQLEGWTSDEEFSAAFEVAAESDGRHGLYLGMVKKFGRQRGLVIYNRIKNEYEKLTAKTSAQ